MGVGISWALVTPALLQLSPSLPPPHTPSPSIFRKAAIGPSKLGLAAGAIASALVLILVSGADFSPGTNRWEVRGGKWRVARRAQRFDAPPAEQHVHARTRARRPARRYKGVRPSRPPPDERTAALLETQAASFRCATPLPRSPSRGCAGAASQPPGARNKRRSSVLRPRFAAGPHCPLPTCPLPAAPPAKGRCLSATSRTPRRWRAPPLSPPLTPSTPLAPSHPRALLERNPEDTSALEGLAVTAAKLGSYEEAADLLDKLVAKRPGVCFVCGLAHYISSQ